MHPTHRLLSLVALALVAGCAEPVASDNVWIDVDVSIDDAPTMAQKAADLIDAATDSVRLALPEGADGVVIDAVADAIERGLVVELVSDVDRRDDPGFQRLLELDGVQGYTAGEVQSRFLYEDEQEAIASGEPFTGLVFNGGPVGYFEFAFNQDVSWGSEEAVMASSYVLVDDDRFLTTTHLGVDAPGSRPVLTGRGEYLLDDLIDEHIQLYGGVDAVAVTRFNNPAKSVTDRDWMYPVADAYELEMWLAPQERATKRVIDAIYSARSSVWVLTDDFANEGLATALYDKHTMGFDVRVVIGPAFPDSDLPTEDGDVLNRDSLRYLVANGSRLESDGQSTDDRFPLRRITGAERLPTVVLLDVEQARDGNHYPAEAHFLSLDLYSSTRLFRGSEVKSDQFIDGALWVVRDPQHDGRDSDTLETELQLFSDTFLEHWDRADAVPVPFNRGR